MDATITPQEAGFIRIATVVAHLRKVSAEAVLHQLNAALDALEPVPSFSDPHAAGRLMVQLGNAYHFNRGQAYLQ